MHWDFAIATFYAKNQHGSQIEKLIAARIILIAIPFVRKNDLNTWLSVIAGFFLVDYRRQNEFFELLTWLSLIAMSTIFRSRFACDNRPKKNPAISDSQVF